MHHYIKSHIHSHAMIVHIGRGFPCFQYISLNIATWLYVKAYIILQLLLQTCYIERLALATNLIKANHKIFTIGYIFGSHLQYLSNSCDSLMSLSFMYGTNVLMLLYNEAYN